MKSSKAMINLFLIITSILCVECVKQSVGSELTGRHPSSRSIWAFSPALNRQLFDVVDIITDVAMLTIMGIPILGLVALGASIMGPALNMRTGGARNKRSFDPLERTKRALLYARNLFDVLANLEESFQTYDITDSECQLKTVCEVHKNDSLLSPKYKTFSNQIVDLIRMQKDLEEYEIIPFAKIIFGQYADAATYGIEDNDCDLVYSRCKHKINDFLNKSQKHTTEEEKH